MPEDTGHSPIGASSAERFWNCPGSVALQAKCPPGKDTIYSATGTVAHGVAERWLRSGDRSNKWILKETGRSYVEGGFAVEVTEDMAEAVAVYTEAVWAILDRHHLPASALRVEHGFALPHLDPEAWGTCDGVILAGHTMYVLDYKHGAGHPVEVEENKQLPYYALGAYYELSEDERNDLVDVVVVIVQPRARHAGGAVREYRLDTDALLRFEAGLGDAIRRVRSADPAVAVGNWCKFCAAKAICPGQRQTVAELADLHFTKIETEPVRLPAPAELTPERLGQLLKNADAIADWCDAVRKHATAVAATGQEVTGYEFVQKLGNRRWKDEGAVIDAYKAEFGETLWNKKLRSPAQMEKLLGKGRESELTELYEKPVSGESLVAAGGERKAVAKGVDLFKPVGGPADGV